ncbi:MAG: hypothetical protein KGJ11_02945, partial [Candidatus Omnitrophica bacterium]|nr:hypothetical protein [Candidatus Omnitrophota bacterium]
MKTRSIFLSLIVCLCLTPTAMAQEGKFLDHFKGIPVLQEGRLKPLDTYARNLLIQFSGKDSYDHAPAAAWLAKLLFTPFHAADDKVFLINNPEIATALNIKPEAGRRYSFAELKDAFPKLVQLKEEAANIDERQRTLVENEIIRVAQNVELYIDFSEDFLWAYPDQDFTITSPEIKKQLGLPQDQNQFSFIDMAFNAGKIKDLMLGLKNKSKEQILGPQLELMSAVNNMVHWTKDYQNLPFEVIPPAEGNDWLSPWDAISGGLSEGQRKLIGLWYQMAQAYAAGNFIDFDMAAQSYLGAVKENLKPRQLNIIRKFPLEMTYEAAKPFLWARIFYILAFIFFIISFTSSKKVWYVLGLLSVVAGFIPHTLGLVARIIIMARPPVTNLYETFIFVGFISVLLGLGIEYFNRRWLGLVTAAICGTILLFIAGRYSAEGDTLKMLVAVLNSNFWLATHV